MGPIDPMKKQINETSETMSDGFYSAVGNNRACQDYLTLSSLFGRVMGRGSLFKVLNDGSKQDEDATVATEDLTVASAGTSTSLPSAVPPVASMISTSIRSLGQPEKRASAPARTLVREYSSKLLEDFPAQRRCTTGNVDGTADDAKAEQETPSAPPSPPPPPPPPRRKNLSVRFSDSAFLHVYTKDFKQARRLSYTKSDQKRFTREALVQAMQVKRLLHEHVPEGFKGSFSEQIEMCDLEKEEVVGLEQMTLEKSQASILKRRKFLWEMIFLEQEKQKEKGVYDPEILGRIARYITKKSEKHALRRGQLSC